MALFNKKEKPAPEPQYYTSATNEQVYNYNVYYMNKTEKTIVFIISFILGAAVGYLFYGGIGKDENGHATIITYGINMVVMCLVGFVATRIVIPIYKESKISKRKNKLRLQFIDLLDSLSTSISSGKNVPSSFIAAKEDLLLQYDEDAYVVKETQNIIVGIDNNIPVEDLLIDFGNRSGIDDITNFGYVFQTVYRKGGNIKDTILSCHDLLREKIEIELTISTKIASAKNEQNIMLIMPVALVAMLKMMGSDFAENFASPTGIISTTIAVILFIVAFFVGRRLSDIEV